MGALVLSALLLAAAADEPQVYPGEERRVHLGAGLRGAAGGLLVFGEEALPVARSEVFGLVDVTLQHHDELRILFAPSLGYPDYLGGELGISVLHRRDPRVSMGFGGSLYLGFQSAQLGVEGLAVRRLGDRGRHQLQFGARLSAGVFNTLPNVWWAGEPQRFALGLECSLAYAFFFF